MILPSFPRRPRLYHRLRLSPVVLRGAVGAEDHQARPQRLHARGDVADAEVVDE